MNADLVAAALSTAFPVLLLVAPLLLGMLERRLLGAPAEVDDPDGG